MAVKNKIFSVSSLIIIAIVAVLFAHFSDDSIKADMEHEETVEVRNSQSSSKLVPEDEKTQTEKVVDNIDSADNTKDFQEKYDEITKEETSPENELGFEPIPGIEIPGVDYKEYIDYSKYTNIAIIGAKQYVNIRKGAGEKNEIVGKIQPNGGCKVLGTINDSKNITWAKIQSGNVIGYVKQEFLITGKEAMAMVSSVGRLVIRATCDELNVRENPSITSKILYRIDSGEELDVVSATNDWIEVRVDFGDESAYVSREFAKIQYKLHYAYSISKIKYDENDTSESKETFSLRENMVNFAEDHLGCPYKLGGNSFKTGIDCSAFVKTIYAKYGYSLPRRSIDQANVGKSITAAQLKPGDLVFYRRGGKIGHVAMYIGNNRIIHASNPRDGVKYSNMYYTTPAKFVRVINN